MSLTINTNTAAISAAFNLAKNNEMLNKSLNRLSSGKRITKPSDDGSGGYRAMEMALKESELLSEDIQYVNAHGTSTPVGDMIELSAVERLFSSNEMLYMSSNKSSIGHLLGAAGAVEAVFSLKSLKTEILPPTLNLDNPDIGCDLNYSAHQATQKMVTYSLSNSFGFGGTNATLIFKELD